MVDFLVISTRSLSKGSIIEVYPKFVVKKSGDLMIRGGDFYAVWLEEAGRWSTDEFDVINMVDAELDAEAAKLIGNVESTVTVAHMWDSSYPSIDNWHGYCQRKMRDNYTPLDEKLVFEDTPINKADYSSKRLDYPLKPGPCPSYERLMSTLYDEKERHKLEWAIGSIVVGDSKTIQKFIVMYGPAGTGKSTVLNIIEQLFQGYFTTFDAKSLGSNNNSFALESFKSNPLVAIQHDGDLSRIEDNTKLNSLISHEMMTVNEKFKSAYNSRFISFLFMGTNRPVKITDSKSGLIRRLIDVHPSGNKLKPDEYDLCMSQIPFELGPIACHCRDVYLQNRKYYSRYVPTEMLRASNDFYNFMIELLPLLRNTGSIDSITAWDRYQEYCDRSKVLYPLSKRPFIEEMSSYFDTYTGSGLGGDFIGFKFSRFDMTEEDDSEPLDLIDFNSDESVLNDICKNDLAQYAKPDGSPIKAWADVKTTLEAIDPRRLHYLLISDPHHIVIDFDIPDESGEKSLERNLEAASKWPKTYAELSKSGKGIHLHYIYTGDLDDVSPIYAPHIEIKIFRGKSSLRRKFTKSNGFEIATLSSGLPKKEVDNVIDFDTVKNEKAIRTIIKKNLNKEYHSYTTPSVQFIKKVLDDAYSSGITYDVEDMKPAIFAFAASSTNGSKKCIAMVNEMKWKSKDAEEEAEARQQREIEDEQRPIVFFDLEVFPNLLLVNWKYQGEGKAIVRMINPDPSEIRELCQYRLIGFNNRRYDNHILYARMLGYTNEQIYNLSSKITSSKKGENQSLFFREAYNLSYTDIYDFASAGNKKSLKKLEIEMGIHHQELGLPWDQPVPEDKWEEVAAYCDNDVIATEAAFNYLSADWTARQILAELAGMSVNTSTNTLTAKIIFGDNRKPQAFFKYRNLGEPVMSLPTDVENFLREACPDMMAQKHGSAGSLLPYFEGYTYSGGKSRYRGEEVNEGGYVYAEPGMYTNVALLDISSMHPHSAIAECLFGVTFTRRFREIVEGRVDIKHEDWDELDNILDGKLTPFVQKIKNGEMRSKDLANGLKTAINAVYGQTYARYENPFRDKRNIDNLVAKRGALFMVDLKHAVQERGFTVAHIKTDSIKIPNATPEIIQFVMDFGKRYGYSFEHEATYERMCLVNDAVYVCRYDDGHWDATGTQFKVPYVFKSLFSKEDIEFDDMCETKSVSSGAIFLDLNEGYPDVTAQEKELDKLNAKISKAETVTNDMTNRREELWDEIAKGHNYTFIGRVGSFCPIEPGYGGAWMVRSTDKGTYDSVVGTSGFRWLESEMVRKAGLEDHIDRRYYDGLVAAAIETISQYGDFEWFANPDNEDSPPWQEAEEPWYDEDDIFNKR